MDDLETLLLCEGFREGWEIARKDALENKMLNREGVGHVARFFYSKTNTKDADEALFQENFALGYVAAMSIRMENNTSDIPPLHTLILLP